MFLCTLQKWVGELEGRVTTRKKQLPVQRIQEGSHVRTAVAACGEPHRSLDSNAVDGGQQRLKTATEISGVLACGVRSVLTTF